MRTTADRPIEVASCPNLEPEDRFAITQTAQGLDHVIARQQLPGGEGFLSAGWIGVLADFATGRAVQALVGSDIGFRTFGLRMDFGVAGLRSGAELVATGQVVDSGGGALLGTARIVDDRDAFVANVSTRFVVVGRTEPQCRIPSNWSVPQTNSLGDFLGAKLVERSSDRAIVVAPAADWMRNPYGIIHGGIVVALADVGLDSAAHTAAGPATLLSLDVTFQRPAVIGDVPMVADATIERVGGRVVTASAKVYQETPTRPVVTAAATFLRVSPR